MDEGFHMDGRYQQAWMRWKRQKSLWMSTVFKDDERRRGVAWRCTGHGLVNIYARDVVT